ncbi:MAG: transcriptional regulator [Micavibrio aeruginosavorus]|uniref:Transcriptional regulator n=1 Tax=Micavibrio aeruginosavorus TaxID=349221 RepID=A0A2W5Q0T7_9BACT|nr:MAG: transcriptional regulator [Micavibrio aeruginosavorus]
MDKTLKMLMGPWTTYILWLLHSNGAQRFGQLKKQMPSISAKMLTERLKMLVEAGILIRTQEQTIPPKVSYELSLRGRELNKVLEGLHDLAIRWDEQDRKKSA